MTFEEYLDTSYGPVNLAHCAPMIQEEIDLLGDADPFASQRGLVDRLRAQLAGLPAEALDWKPAPREWSVHEVVAHLAQSELVYGFRYRWIVAFPGTPVAGYDQEVWIDGLPDKDQPIEELLDELAAMKSFNMAFLERLTDEERARHGLHSERGPESVAALIGGIAGHDILHERQIAENIRQWRIRAA